tara:strand:- start:145 stop:657 length:513 start_codon:yes stop_codon:yes gene_type:complete
MFNQGASWYGYTNGSAPTSISDVQKYIEYFNINSGSGEVPAIQSVVIPQVSGGEDSEGNAIVRYNFTTLTIPSGTISGEAYYTWFIPDDSIGGTSSGDRQTVIDVSFGQGPNTFSPEIMDSGLYNFNPIVNPGGNFINGSYRVYSTNSIGSGFFFDNEGTTIYFKGNTVT